MKKYINITMVTIIFLIGAFAVANNKINTIEGINKIINNQEVVQAAAVEEVEKEFKIINTYVTESENMVIEFSDQSAAVINPDKQIYEFYAAECGDYEIPANNHSELINIIKTYMINKYNMNDLEVKNHSIFNNKNLTI